jgi:pyrroloquinoline quinone (PQQ) biosynthesis protein C/mannose-6-phosphate isomerase-like protein (cupin superfamily)
VGVVARVRLRLGSQNVEPAFVEVHVDRLTIDARALNLAPSVFHQLVELREAANQHPFWENRLFQACQAGLLTREDFQLVFSQYYLYSSNFTRYIAGLMASCENDYFRSRLSENLWEEAGESDPSKRHSEIFRRFLTYGLGIDLKEIRYRDFTRYFVREFLEICRRSSPIEASATLSVGTEGIVARMYQIFMDGLVKAGVDEQHLTFFRIHIGCDDAHAETIEMLMASFSREPYWETNCHRSMQRALDLRRDFFENIYEAVIQRRLDTTVDRIYAKRSLLDRAAAPGALLHRPGSYDPKVERCHESTPEKVNVEFNVDRINFGADIFDTKVLRIAPQKSNEKLKYAHESLFIVQRGQGRVHVDETVVDIHQGDVVFIPRWATHQTVNTGDTDLVIVALTDHGLTQRVFGNDPLLPQKLTLPPTHPPPLPHDTGTNV